MQRTLGLSALVFSAFGFAAPVGAETAWRTMNAYQSATETSPQISFPPTTESAEERLREQGFSDEAAAYYGSQLEAFIDEDPTTESICRWVGVKDGVVYATMSMNRPDFGPVAHNLNKQLGGINHAIECVVVGKTVHWYSHHDAGGDCNNVGVVKPPQKTAPPPVKKETCRWVQRQPTVHRGQTVVTQGLSVGCGTCQINIPGVVVQTPDTTITGSTLVCD